MAKLPKKITLDLEAKKLLVDGEEFPWYITEEGADVQGLGDPNRLPTVTISILADTVEVLPEPERDGD